MNGWHDFLAAEVQSTSALAGLLFVALSINISQIMKSPTLPQLGAQALTMLIASLLELSYALIPQPAQAAGVEILATAGLLLLFLTRSALRTRPADAGYRKRWLWKIAELQVAIIPAIICGGCLLVGIPGAPYWLAGSVIATIALAAYNAWILLVEILR